LLRERVQFISVKMLPFFDKTTKKGLYFIPKWEYWFFIGIHPYFVKKLTFRILLKILLFNILIINILLII